MRHILFILLLLPFALFAQTDWSKSPYDQTPVEIQNFETATPYEEKTQEPENRVVLIEGYDKGWFSTGLLKSKTYIMDGDTVRGNQLEPLLLEIPKAKEELSASRNWGYAGLLFALVAVVGVNVWAYGSDDVSVGGGIATLGGFFLEGYCVRQSNNHYNTAIDIYNALQRGDDKPTPSDTWGD